MADQHAAPVQEAAIPAPLAPNGIHLLRTAQLMQLQLSQMADQKASILMGATFVVFTLAVGQLGAGRMMLPIFILALTAFCSAVLAILTVLPRITRLRAEAVGPDANILFFGIFTALPEEVFIDRLVATAATDEGTYRAMARDIYQNGQVLQRRKYRYLGYAYRVFLTGLVLSAAAVLVELARGFTV